jgi:hypothetical protein
MSNEGGMSPELTGELYLASHLAAHGVRDVFAGITDAAERKARIRSGIIGAGLATVICGTKERKPVTYAQAFERLYGEALDQRHQRVGIKSNTSEGTT